MTTPPTPTPLPLDHELIRCISLDLADGYDEELEMEIEDRHSLPGVPSGAQTDAERTIGKIISATCFGSKPNSSSYRTGWSRQEKRS
jgi:hypothetical protein